MMTACWRRHPNEAAALHHQNRWNKELVRSAPVPELGAFIRPAFRLNQQLIGAYRPYVESFMERTASQGKPKLLTNGEGKPVTRDEYCKDTWGVGVRRVNQLLAAKAQPQKRKRKSKPTQAPTPAPICIETAANPASAPAPNIVPTYEHADLLKQADLVAYRIVGNETYAVDAAEAAEKYLIARGLSIPKPCDDSEPGSKRKPQYVVTLKIEASTYKTVEKKAKEAFGEKLMLVTKVERNFSRADDLDDAQDKVEGALEIVRDLQTQMEEWRDNMPDSLQCSEKYSEVDGCAEALSSLGDELEGIRFDEIEFPGMF